MQLDTLEQWLNSIHWHLYLKIVHNCLFCEIQSHSLNVHYAFFLNITIIYDGVPNALSIHKN